MPPSRQQSSWQKPMALAWKSCLKITRFWQCSPVATWMGAIARAILAWRLEVDNGLVDVPHLVRVHHQLALRADHLADDGRPPPVVLEALPHLHLHVRPAAGYRLLAKGPQLLVGITEPTDRGGVGGKAGFEHLGLAFAAAGRQAPKDGQRLIGRDGIADVAEVDAGNELFGT
jgi:hypothetical protein